MKLQFHLDDHPISVEIDERHQVLDLLRNTCDRKDLLAGCSPQGVCGSCLIIVKGKPRLACTLRAKNIHNKQVNRNFWHFNTKFRNFACCIFNILFTK